MFLDAAAIFTQLTSIICETTNAERLSIGYNYYQK
jgi:hypothetical protein